MLGTGTPRPDPNCAGPATVIVANNTTYLVDFGPGVVRRASAAYDKGVKALGYGGVNIKTAFLTHMHSDHTIGYPDLIFTPWVAGRHDPLFVYGPNGIKSDDAEHPQGLANRHRRAQQWPPSERSSWVQGKSAGDRAGPCLQGRERHGHGIPGAA